ncbi:DUF723 domain-containing protein [Neisseria sp. N95_16]|uniref:DUF723 domain-containing protein n=1 Tax=Neisseria brasiliensis TaxID=2666100 RepID=A0A7X2KZS6_9NEIS|nr:MULTISPECIES: DUF723 domain-containing protein [Neisseria]MRN38595.1 DUF723 domain-containing protein [Neisseria brasiliensis]PJO10764.1 DUF723 domain-containing protein [Neisseria sp. N95_16]
MAYTFEQAQEQLTQTFPDSGFELVDFRGIAEKVTIRCPKHGEQTVARLSNLLRSEKGCPACGVENKKQATITRNKNDQAFLKSLRVLVEENADAESFKEAAIQYLGNKDKPKRRRRKAAQPEIRVVHDEALADRLVAERVRLDFSRQEIADRLAIEKPLLMAYETATELLPSNLLAQMAGYGYNIDYILTGKKSSVGVDQPLSSVAQSLQGDSNSQVGGDVTANHY